MGERLDQLYDGWREARGRGLTLAQHARELGMDVAELRAKLEGLLALESAMPASSLVGDALVEGASFAGFRLLKWLGEGATGVVHEARDERAGHDGGSVALKVVNPLLCAVAERRELLLREARVSQRLDHPNIVKIHDCGVERGWAWIAMDLAAGRRFDELGRVDERRALRLALQLARALEHAHARGVVHRDLKPGNVLVGPADELKVLDFGLARSVADPLTLSATGALVGTPAYMAPEQVRPGMHVGPATDVHAVGLLLRDALLGAPDMASMRLARQLERLGRGERALGWSEIARLPTRTRRIVERCTRPHPADRMPDATTLAEEIERALAGTAPKIDARGLVASAARGLARSRMVLFGLPVVVVAGTGWWRLGPVPVEFDTRRSGKQVWIDGEDRGTAPVRAWLTPGSHRWRARFGSSGPWHEGEIEVEHGRTNRFLEVLQPMHGVPWAREIGIGDEEPGAWVQVSTPLDRVRLEIDGSQAAEVPGICSFRLAPGSHRIEVAAPGRRPRAIDLVVREDRLISHAFELDPEDSEWTTTLLYSAIDEPVRRALASVNAARLVWESAPIGQTDRHAERVYYAPDEAWAVGQVDLTVPLPDGWREIEVELLRGPQFTGAEAWSTVEAGPNEDSLVLLARHSQRDSTPWESETHLADNVHYVRPAKHAMEELARRMQGARGLRLRLRAGGAPAPSGSVGWAQMLRCEFLPMHPPGGRLQWAPAARIRTR